MPKSTIVVWILAVAAACLAIAVLHRAAGWYDRPIPGVLLTSDGNVSSVGMPTWSGIEQGLRFPDRVLSVDGEAVLPQDGRYAARVWDRAVLAAAQQGRASVHVQVATSIGVRELDLRFEPLDPVSWWLYAGCTIFMGGLYALAAVIAITSSPDGALARTFAKFATLGALFLLGFFDAHTSRTIVPVFHVAFAWMPFALVALALRIPDDVSVIARHPWLLHVLDAGGLVLVAAVLFRDRSGAPVTEVLTVCTLCFAGSMLAFVVILGVRYARARDVRREALRVVFRAMATPYVLVGAGILLALLSSRGATVAFFAIPALALAPIATGIAFIRHDLWDSRALLSRVITRFVAGATASVLAVFVGAAFATSVGVSFPAALIAAAAGALVSVPMVHLVTRAVERRFFPAITEYKPTIEQLSQELTSITDPEAVAAAVERTVRRWLPCEHVEFRASEPAPSGEDVSAPVVRQESPDRMTIPAAFGGRDLGLLVVGRKRGGALFTTDDIDLLRTIANQAGLALAHAHSYAELERRRRQQAAAWQIERVALVETVAAEIAHEVRYPINFFRSVFRRDPGHAQLDPEEIDIGCEEVDRLERLVSGLRRLVGHRIERRAVSVGDLAARTEMLLRDVLRGRTLEVSVPRDLGLRCDPDQVTQVLVNLVANAIDATGMSDHIGVRWNSNGKGSELEVWDDGPGFAGDASQLFAPWFTTKPRGTGLGLAITQRIVRAHGWSIDALRLDGRTRFVVTVPSADVVGGEGRNGADSDGMRAAAALGDEHHEDTDRR